MALAHGNSGPAGGLLPVMVAKTRAAAAEESPPLTPADRESRIQAGRQRFEELRAARRARASCGAEVEPSEEASTEAPAAEEPLEPDDCESTDAENTDPQGEEADADDDGCDLPEVNAVAKALSEEEAMRDEEMQRLEAMVQALQRNEALTMTELQVKRQRIAAAEMNTERWKLRAAVLPRAWKMPSAQ